MAPKGKSVLVDDPPSASSSEEQEPQQEEEEEEEEEEVEEEGEDEEESAEESDEEEPRTAPPVEKKSATQMPLQQKPTQSSSSSSESSESGRDDGSGSDSDADSGQSEQPSPSASDFHVKPSVPATTSKPPTKRPQETQKERDSRSRKKPKIAVEEEEKKPSVATPTTRLWSDEDQIALLNGMVEFKAQKGSEPNSDMSAFHDFVRGKLQVDVSKSQLTDKLRRLKKKFLTSVRNGSDPVFAKPHDYSLFELSKKIWGGAKGDSGSSNNGVTEAVNKNHPNGKAKKTPVEDKKSSEPKKTAKPKDDEKPTEDEKQATVNGIVKEDTVKVDQPQDFQSKYPRLALSFDMADLSKDYPNAMDMLKKNMSLIDGEKAKVLEEKWKKLHEEEADLVLKRLDLIKEHFKLVIDAMRGN